MAQIPKGNRQTNIHKHLWEHHYEMIRLTAMGWTVKPISIHLKCSAQTVSDTLNSPIAQERIRELRARRDGAAVDIAKDIAKVLPEAVAKVAEVMRTTVDDKTAISAAGMLLDRGGHAPQRNVNVKGMVAHITSDDIKELKGRLKHEGEIVSEEVAEAVIVEEVETVEEQESNKENITAGS